MKHNTDKITKLAKTMHALSNLTINELTLKRICKYI